MNRYIIIVAIALLVALTGPGVAAQDSLPQYRVELLVFRHLNPDTTELQPLPDIVEEPMDDITAEQLEQDPEEPAREPVVPVPATVETLSEAHQTLLRSRDYSPLLAQAWIQSVANHGATDGVPISGNRGGAYLSGTVTVSVERFLRLGLDLQLTDLDGQTFHLIQARRLRSGEIHYFDHARFGVIAQITPAE